ncbi:MAG: P-II family nitrogen regulator [Thermodesulfobacteriota bacterium]
MKEIKAYIRQIKAEEVIHALEEAGVPGLAIIEVKAIGKEVEGEKTRFSIDYAEKVCSTVKIEVVCRDEDSERLASIISKAAHTGQRGDGMIFVSDVAEAVKIRTGESGESALLPTDKKEG